MSPSILFIRLVTDYIKHKISERAVRDVHDNEKLQQQPCARTLPFH